jgi:ribosomal protein L37AE/L43A
MAQTIRPVLCPQCGSPQHTPLGPGLFRCAACQTEYYLDSDDVTVNVRHHYAPAAPVGRPPLSWG